MLVCVPVLPTITAATGDDTREHTAVASCRGDEGIWERVVLQVRRCHERAPLDYGSTKSYIYSFCYYSSPYYSKISVTHSLVTV